MAESMTIVVATIGQGLMYSPDAGETWQRLAETHSEAMVRTLLTVPSRPGVVFAGTDRGLYRSEDNGRHWALVESPISEWSIWSLASDPANPEIMFAGTGTPSPAGCFRSTDGGKTWERRPVEVAASCANVGVPRVLEMAVDPTNGANVWMTIEVDGVRYSRDGGDTWQEWQGVTRGRDAHSVLITPGDPKSVFVIMHDEAFQSTDDGVTWTDLRAKEVFPWRHLRMITAKPGEPETLFLAIGDWTPGRTGAVMRSRDGGRSWENLPLGTAPNSAMWRVRMQPAAPDLVFAASRYGYLYRSDDGGDSWRKLWREFSEIADMVWFPN